MRKGRLLGLILSYLGVAIFLIKPIFSFTGFVIILNSNEILDYSIYFFGLGLILLGSVIILYENNSSNYYKRRVLELFNPKYDLQDAWIHRGEIEGIISELKNNSNYKKLDIEHGNDAPTIHLPELEHMHIKTKDSSRHLLITNNPYDSRIENVGLVSSGKNKYDQDIGQKVKSKVYTPSHPRSKDLGRILIETMSPAKKKAA